MFHYHPLWSAMFHYSPRKRAKHGEKRNIVELERRIFVWQADFLFQNRWPPSPQRVAIAMGADFGAGFFNGPQALLRDAAVDGHAAVGEVLREDLAMCCQVGQQPAVADARLHVNVQKAAA